MIITGQNEECLNADDEALGDGAIPVDVRSLADLDRLATQVESAFGKLDILFANAGIGYFAPLEQVDEAFGEFH